MKTEILNLKDYKESTHKVFTHTFVNINGKITSIYKNKGYSKNSVKYGTIFQIFGKPNTFEETLTFKTKEQVIKELECQIK